MWQIKARLLYNKKIKGHYFRCGFAAPLIAKKINPGQFVNIRLRDAFDPLLRRPFSIHRVSGARIIEILYAVIGKGTEALTQKKPGEYLDVIGPLGNGFSMPNPRSSILVSGGMGVAPLLFLAERIKKYQSIKVSKYQSIVLIGAKTKSQILCQKEFKALGCAVKISTDDGSRGFKGKVTELLKNLLSTMDYELRTIYACGPRPMLKEITFISKRYNIPAQISLEEHLACGFGACLGCAVNTDDGYQRVCKEGPVFDADEIIW